MAAWEIRQANDAFWLEKKKHVAKEQVVQNRTIPMMDKILIW